MTNTTERNLSKQADAASSSVLAAVAAINRRVDELAPNADATTLETLSRASANAAAAGRSLADAS